MKYSNFRDYKRIGRSPRYFTFNATIDVETGFFKWKKKVSMKIFRKYGDPWYFVKNGENCERDEVYKLENSYLAKIEIDKLKKADK